MTENLERLFGAGPLHTDNWPRLEFAAPKQLNTNDFSIEENLMAKRWLSPETKATVRAGRDMDGLLDMAEFFASVGSRFFAIPRFDDLSPSQQERYQKIVHGYCSEELVTNYGIFFEEENKRQCAELQAEKMRKHLAEQSR